MTEAYAKEAGYDLVDKMMGKEQDFLKNASKLQEMQRLVQSVPGGQIA